MSSFENRFYERQCRQTANAKEAKRVGLTHNPYLILKSLADRDWHDTQEIVQMTGIYSNLPCVLRYKHRGSLAALGYIEENLTEGNTDRGFAIPCIVFRITEEGLKVLDRAKEGD